VPARDRPGKPHEKGCYHYINQEMLTPYFGYGPPGSLSSLSYGPPPPGPPPPFEIKSKGETDYFLQAQLQAQVYKNALLWLNQASVYPVASACPPGLPGLPGPVLVPVKYYCNCANESQTGVHEDSCPVTAGQQAVQVKDLAQQACTCAAEFFGVGHAAYCPLAPVPTPVPTPYTGPLTKEALTAVATVGSYSDDWLGETMTATVGSYSDWMGDLYLDEDEVDTSNLEVSLDVFGIDVVVKAAKGPPVSPVSPVSPVYANCPKLPCDCGTGAPPSHYTDCPQFVWPPGQPGQPPGQP
jgi:hypothetical protein